MKGIELVIGILIVSIVGVLIAIQVRQDNVTLLEPARPVQPCTPVEATAPEPTRMLTMRDLARQRITSFTASDGSFGYVDLADPNTFEECPCARQLETRHDWRYKYWDCRCSRTFLKDAAARSLAARATRPKGTWDCAMDRALLSRLTTQPLQAQFKVTSIDCRSVDCLIMARGVEAEAPDIFRAAIDDLTSNESMGLSINVRSGSSRNGDDSYLHALVMRRLADERP